MATGKIALLLDLTVVEGTIQTRPIRQRLLHLKANGALPLVCKHCGSKQSICANHGVRGSEAFVAAQLVRDWRLYSLMPV